MTYYIYTTIADYLYKTYVVTCSNVLNMIQQVFDLSVITVLPCIIWYRVLIININHKNDKNVGKQNQTFSVLHWLPQFYFCVSYYVRHWGPAAVWLPTFFKKKKVNDGIILIFEWTIPLSCQSDDRRHVEDSVRQDYHHSFHLVPSKYDTIDYRVNLQTTICRSSVFVRSSKASVSATFDLWLLFTSKAVS